MNSLQQELYQACRKGNLEKVKKLVSLGANVKQAYVYIYPISIASCNGHLSIVKYLVSEGADPKVDNNISIRWASESGYLEIVKYLYSIGCDPTDYNNDTIYMASREGHLETVKFLASIGCDTNRIYNKTMEKEVEDYLIWLKKIKNCNEIIYGHPALERTKTENVEFFNKI